MKTLFALLLLSVTMFGQPLTNYVRQANMKDITNHVDYRIGTNTNGVAIYHLTKGRLTNSFSTSNDFLAGNIIWYNLTNRIANHLTWFLTQSLVFSGYSNIFSGILYNPGAGSDGYVISTNGGQLMTVAIASGTTIVEPPIVPGTTNQVFIGDKSWEDFLALFDWGWSLKTTDHLPEGSTNQYFNTNRVDEHFEYRLSVDTNNFTGSNTFSTIKVTNLFDVRNVKFYGAKGDGSDDTVALQAALDSLRPLYFPSGNYYITSALRGHSELYMFGDGTDVSMVYTSNNIDMMEFVSTVNRCQIFDMRFSHYGDGSNVWNFHDPAYHLRFDNVFVANGPTFAGDVLVVTNATGLTPYEIHVQGGSWNWTHGKFINALASEVFLNNCKFAAQGTNFAELYFTSSGWINIANCGFEGTRLLMVSCHNSIVSGNYFSYPYDTAIYAYSSVLCGFYNNIISNITAYATIEPSETTRTNAIGILLAGYSTNNIVMGNHISTLHTNGYAISETDPAGHNTIALNDTRDWTPDPASWPVISISSSNTPFLAVDGCFNFQPGITMNPLSYPIVGDDLGDVTWQSSSDKTRIARITGFIPTNAAGINYVGMRFRTHNGLDDVEAVKLMPDGEMFLNGPTPTIKLSPMAYPGLGDEIGHLLFQSTDTTGRVSKIVGWIPSDASGVADVGLRFKTANNGTETITLDMYPGGSNLFYGTIYGPKLYLNSTTYPQFIIRFDDTYYLTLSQNDLDAYGQVLRLNPSSTSGVTIAGGGGPITLGSGTGIAILTSGLLGVRNVEFPVSAITNMPDFALVTQLVSETESNTWNNIAVVVGAQSNTWDTVTSKEPAFSKGDLGVVEDSGLSYSGTATSRLVSSGTLSFGIASGRIIPTEESTNEWDTAYTHSLIIDGSNPHQNAYVTGSGTDGAIPIWSGSTTNLGNSILRYVSDYLVPAFGSTYYLGSTTNKWAAVTANDFVFTGTTSGGDYFGGSMSAGGGYFGEVNVTNALTADNATMTNAIQAGDYKSHLGTSGLDTNTATITVEDGLVTAWTEPGGASGDGDLLEGTGISFSGTGTDRLVGAGDLTITLGSHGHPASDITQGTFGAGDYKFEGSLSVTNAFTSHTVMATNSIQAGDYKSSDGTSGLDTSTATVTIKDGIVTAWTEPSAASGLSGSISDDTIPMGTGTALLEDSCIVQIALGVDVAGGLTLENASSPDISTVAGGYDVAQRRLILKGTPLELTTWGSSVAAVLDDDIGTTFTGPIILDGQAPSSSTAVGTTGQLGWNSSYLFICTSGGAEGAATWKRITLETW